MRRLLVGILLAGVVSVAHAAETKRPAWCQPGFECVPRAELVADAEYHYALREQVLKYKARARRFGFSVGPGIGVTEVVDEQLDLHHVYGIGLYLTWGIRF